MPKAAFSARQYGLHEFTQILFNLSNSGSSCSHLMEMCLGNQQFIMLLLNCDDICIFPSSMDEMLDRMEFVCQR